MNYKTCFKFRDSQIVYEFFDDEVILIDFNNGSYYHLNVVGLIILKGVEEEKSLLEIIQLLFQNFINCPPDLQQVVTTFLEELQRESLIVVNTEALDNGNNTEASQNDPSSESLPVFQLPSLKKYTDMQDLLLLDPIHDVDDAGWPVRLPSSR
ncbi:MAG: PqqD family protein [Nostoc sp.]|uniref:PqqD family protein n=1 Tax=Nostoc sp. TaxID=1180 RepID=UPI002FF535FC